MTTPTKTEETTTTGSSMWSILRLRNVRLLWLGEAISVLGDQFHMIALPWLVLLLTNDALAVGTVLAVAGIPRAIFMLIGGSLVDRFSPRSLMLWSNLARMTLVIILATVVLTGVVNLWMLYLLALLFGLADSFFFPAQGAIVPQIVETKDLQAANSLIQGTAQLSIFLGPMLAGGMIALLGGSPEAAAIGGEHALAAEASAQDVPGLTGIGLAFLFDAFTFLASAITLALMRVDRPVAAENKEESVLRSTVEGIKFVWDNLTLRWVFLTVAGITFLINGPLMVGIPVLARQLPEGAVAFGIISSAFGLGSLTGTILAGVLPRPLNNFGWVFVVSLIFLGIMTALFGLASSVWVAALVMLLLGIGDGYIVIMFITWLQGCTPQSMMGRMMGLLMVASIGLNPISNALSGAVMSVSITLVFVASGVIMVLFSLLMATRPEIIGMGNLSFSDELPEAATP